MEGHASHLPLLDIIAANKELFTALEFGAGVYSTPWLFLHADDVTSVDLKQEWIDKAKAYHTEDLARWLPYTVKHEFDILPTISGYYYDIVLIDGGDYQARRAVTQALLALGSSNLFILHDAERCEYIYHTIVLPIGYYALRIETPEYPWTLIITNEPQWKDIFSKLYRCAYYADSHSLFTRMSFPCIEAFKEEPKHA